MADTNDSASLSNIETQLQNISKVLNTLLINNIADTWIDRKTNSKIFKIKKIDYENGIYYVKNANNILEDINFKSYELDEFIQKYQPISLENTKNGFIQKLSANLFANTSFDLDKRPVKTIAKSCIERATILANYLFSE